MKIDKKLSNKLESQADSLLKIKKHSKNKSKKLKIQRGQPFYSKESKKLYRAFREKLKENDILD